MTRPFSTYFLIAKIDFNPKGAWPNNEIRHDSFMEELERYDPYHIFYAHNFRNNYDGTMTPLSRNLEWKVAIAKAAGEKYIKIING